MRSVAKDPESAAWLLDCAPESTVLTDQRGVIRYVNPAFVAMTGFERGEALGRTPSIVKSGAQSPEFYARLWQTLNAGQAFSGVLINRRRNGELFHEEKTVRPLFDDDGRILYFLSSGRDISRHVADLERLRHAATHDSLTGLPNRRLFVERLAVLLHHARRHGDHFAVALVDVNEFKAVNDRHGHAAGDEVLREVARRLQCNSREADTVARLGGDEFGLLLAGVGDRTTVGRVIRNVSEAFAPPISLGARGAVDVSVSIGVCVRTATDHDPQVLLERADAAMYRFKRAREGAPLAGARGAATPAAGRLHPVRQGLA